MSNVAHIHFFLFSYDAQVVAFQASRSLAHTCFLIFLPCTGISISNVAHIHFFLFSYDAQVVAFQASAASGR
jgi:hypothetical protein